MIPIDTADSATSPAPNFLARLVTLGRRLNVSAGTRLFSPGAACTQFLFVADGTVRVQVATANGRELVLYRVGPGENCPMTSACLLGKRRYLAEGIVETDLDSILLDPSAFERLLIESASFRAFVFSAFAERLAGLTARIEEVAMERIDVRLARLILRHADVLDCTHQHLAVELGSAREVVSRQLKSFEQSGWLALRRGRIEVRDRDALQALAGGVT